MPLCVTAHLYIERKLVHHLLQTSFEKASLSYEHQVDEHYPSNKPIRAEKTTEALEGNFPNGITVSTVQLQQQNISTPTRAETI